MVLSCVFLIPVLLIILFLLTGCARSVQQTEASQPERNCDQYPNNGDCVCPEGLTKRASSIGLYCENITCFGYLTHDGQCVDECPEGYEPIMSTAPGPPPDCVIEGYFSSERRKQETECEKDNDCVWDEYEINSCCTCIPQIVNVKTRERNMQWREKNCVGPANYSEWKWRLCPDSPYIEHRCNWTIETEPLICWEGKKCTV
ncbi:MAG: hypothetical protein KJ593_07455 [Candidatus Omnitrophica bacterium]|nr:hypothetical protein [Candidatus Omnitrophota bacterium]